MTTEAGSQNLRELANRLVRELNGLAGHLRHGPVLNLLHDDFCRRAAEFSDHVSAALLLQDHGKPAQALGVLRTALDHWAADLVMMLGDRFVQLYGNAGETELADAVRRWERGELPSVVERPTLVGRGATKLRLVRRGLVSDDGSIVLHPMFFETQTFDPFFGPPDQQPAIADWLDASDAHDYALDQRRRYNTFFRWGALVESLALNRIVEHRHRLHLNVHHRFLSAFVHSHHAAHAVLHSPQPRERTPPGHAVDELISLYAVQLGARYLASFVQMTERPPTVGLANRAELEELIDSGLEQAQHLWFLEDNPHVFDRGQELLARAAETREFSSDGNAGAAALAVEGVRYYRNPLERLRRMHEGGIEVTTGFSYVSPWA